MGSILSKIEELLNEGNNVETRREKYKPLTINFFDAVYGDGEDDDGRGVADLSPASTTKDRNSIKDKP